MSRRTYLEGLPKWRPSTTSIRNFDGHQPAGRRSRHFYGRKTFQPQFKTVYNGAETYRRQTEENSDETDEDALSRRRDVRKRVRNHIDKIVGDADDVNSQSPPLKLHRVYTNQKQRNNVVKRMEDLIRDDQDDFDSEGDEGPSSSNLTKIQKEDELQTIDVRVQAVAKRIMKMKEARPVGWAKEVEKLEAMQVSLEERRYDLLRQNSSHLDQQPRTSIVRRRSSRKKKPQAFISRRGDRSSQRQKEKQPREDNDDSEYVTTAQDSSSTDIRHQQVVTKEDIQALRNRLSSFMKNLAPEADGNALHGAANERVSQISGNKSRRSDLSDPYQTPQQRLSDHDDSAFIRFENQRNELGIIPKCIDVNYKGTPDFPFDAIKVAARIVSHFPILPLRDSDHCSSYINTCISVLAHRIERARLEMPEENRERSASDEMFNQTTSIERQEDQDSPPPYDPNAQADENIFGDDDHLALEAVADHPSYYETRTNSEDTDEDQLRSGSPAFDQPPEKTPPLERIFNETIRGVRADGDMGHTTMFDGFKGNNTSKLATIQKPQNFTTPHFEQNTTMNFAGGCESAKTNVTFEEYTSTALQTSPPFFDEDNFAVPASTSNLHSIQSRSSSTPSFLNNSRMMAVDRARVDNNVENFGSPYVIFEGEEVQHHSYIADDSALQGLSQASHSPLDWFNRFDNGEQFR